MILPARTQQAILFSGVQIDNSIVSKHNLWSTAEMRPMRRLPRMVRSGWARQCQLIVDIDTRLLPFWQDMRRLYRNLVKIRGAVGLDLLQFDQGPYGPVHRPGKEKTPLAGYPSPDPGAPILIVSDLGLFDQPEGHVAQSWLRFGKMLKRAGFSPVVLTPAPRRLWTEQLTKIFRMACWDRGERLPKLTDARSPGMHPLAADEGRDGTQHLLSLLAPTVRVEPALLRAMRLLLPADQCDAGDEAAVWHHDYVRRGYTGFSFDSQHVADLRKAFVRNHTTALKQRACALIQAHHRHLSPAVVQEERLIAEMLLNGRPSEDAEEFFWNSLKTLSIPDFREKAGLEAWMQRVIRRQEMDPYIWKKSLAMGAFWAKKNYKNWTRGKVVPPKGLDPARVAWVWVKAGLAESYTLYRRGAHFFVEKLSQAESSGTAAYSSGSPVIELISSDGLLQVQAIDSSRPKEYAVNLQNPTPVPIEVPDKGQLRLATTHHEIVLRYTEKPSWAQGWGCDEQGLFVILSHDENNRKAYWFAPGRYPVGDAPRSLVLDDPDRTGLLDGGVVKDFKDGFWWDENDLRQTFHYRFQSSESGHSSGSDDGAAPYYGFQKPDWADDFGVDQYGIYAEFHVRSAVQRLRWIEPGHFMMGSPESEPERNDDEQQHRVALTQGFWMADTACTQALWQTVMEGDPSRFKGEERPVDSLSWDDCQEFIEKINGDIPGLGLHLPTEAQWEYACRAGTTTPFHFGDNITTDQVNFDGKHPDNNKGKKGEYVKKTVPVKSFACNAWGLYEVHENIREWCSDWYGDYPQGTVVDPLGPETGVYRVLRGGPWIFHGVGNVRSAYRGRDTPADRSGFNGFRVARAHGFVGW